MRTYNLMRDLMSDEKNGQISFSFQCLQELIRSFEELENEGPRSPEREEAIYRLVDHLGEVALPVLLRKLNQGAEQARWASLLLMRLGASSHRQRVVSALQQSCTSAEGSDSGRLYASSLLSSLDSDEEVLPLLEDEASAGHSLDDFVACLCTQADVAHAVNYLVGDLDDGALIDFAEELSERAPQAASSVLAEAILRDDLPAGLTHELRTIAAGLPAALNSFPPSKRPGIRFAQHPDGHSAIVCYSAIPDELPKRYRALLLQMEESQGLLHCEYLESVPRSEIDRQFLHQLADYGYDLRAVSLGQAKRHAQIALRLRSRRGLSMPCEYYLGRDLLDLRDEHLSGRDRKLLEQAALLARGIEFLARNQAQQAESLLIDYVEQKPDDPEGLAALGECLLALGQSHAARIHLERALWLAPTIGRYHWNCASLAHREGRLGECYLALQDYLRCPDANNPDNRQLAEALVEDYARQAKLKILTPRDPARNTSGFRQTQDS